MAEPNEDFPPIEWDKEVKPIHVYGVPRMDPVIKKLEYLTDFTMTTLQWEEGGHLEHFRQLAISPEPQPDIVVEDKTNGD